MESRIEQWKHKLLDLSMRNPLLNTQDTKTFLPLKEGGVYAPPSDSSAVVPYVPPEVGEDFTFSCSLSAKEVKARLKEIYVKSRAMYEDSGVNPLFVVVGFLHWREDETDEFHQAPLTMVPASLERTVQGTLGYRVTRTDEDGVVNFCLLELLRTQFKIPVPEIQGGGIGDGDPDYGAVYESFLESIQSRKDWYITTDVALGIFAFDKIVIWKDLADHSAVFASHSFFNHLANRGGIYDDGVSVFDPGEVEQHIHPDQLFCPLSADASQLTAVLYSELGKNFVLHGPPGTGKSQTIANLIAHNLARGRRVLFVSEKRAALDVVYKRLAAVGLSPFCLELHSNKSQKINAMRQFQEALEVQKSDAPAEWPSITRKMSESIADLGVYVGDLHRAAANGLTSFACIAKLAGAHHASSMMLITAPVDQQTPEQVVSVAMEVKKLAEEWKGVGCEAFDALSSISAETWSPQLQMEIEKEVEELLAAARGVNSLGTRLKAVKTAYGMRRHIRVPLAGSPLVWVTELERASEHLAELRLVLAVREHAVAVSKLGCEPFVAAMLRGEFTAEEALQVFEESVAEKTLNALMAASPRLASFSGYLQEQKIANFRELDADYVKAVRTHILATLSQLMPTAESLDKDGLRQLAAIKRESAKKKRIMPIRQLLADTMPVATRLKPCFLMSPLSVAQYLPAQTDLFDLVVFDEASQMTVWDAVATIARGKQLIVVGDPKQLPPTEFFVRADAPDDDPDVNAAATDLESILDECLANGLYSAYLNWHYRSRHEALIALSNHYYYEDRLNTFPAAETNDKLGVSFRYVDGAVYEHQTHTNRGEAEALVEYLYDRLSRDPSERQRSWGIVTFSVSQKKLIESVIERRFAGVDWADDFFNDARPDAFFVKNLENVQGDERDVVIFSIAYAPDAQGNFAMMFGPINHPGGERRLNVAITRAREQIIIFSSTHASAIHAERTNSVGVKHLKALMDFAETGTLEGAGPDKVVVLEEGIVEEVRSFLGSHGYVVDERVGRSCRPIDLAVRDPRDASRHVLAIEFDGPVYAAQRTVRDRDVLREDVLANLGWKYFRLWSVDWKLDRRRIQKRLLEALPPIPEGGAAKPIPPLALPPPAGPKVQPPQLPSPQLPPQLPPPESVNAPQLPPPSSGPMLEDRQCRQLPNRK